MYVLNGVQIYHMNGKFGGSTPSKNWDSLPFSAQQRNQSFVYNDVTGMLLPNGGCHVKLSPTKKIRICVAAYFQITCVSLVLLRSTLVERRSLAGELSLYYTRLSADG